jgi:hypothetical protein
MPMTKTEIYRQLVGVGCSEQYAEYTANANGTGELDKSVPINASETKPKKEGIVSKILGKGKKNGNA